MSEQERARAARARQQRLARWARRTPAYRVAVDRVLPAVRRNGTLNDVVWRVFTPQEGAGTLPVPLHGGRYLTGRDTLLLPVVGVVAVGLAEEQVDTVVEQVADLQRRDLAFRPLLVLDRPLFAVARRHGYVVEVVVPQHAWADQPQGDRPEPVAWEDYLGRRLAGLVDHYQLWHLAHAGPQGLAPVDLAVLRALPGRLPGTLDVRAAEPAPGPSDPA
ncbi:hypothetical protein GCM10009584_10690 [Ornithinimicrobium humiphilum]|uniref:Uncharacterized protein n=1 Tax=Ornithinimicrobium humiphilum TaxID=125288 RepID=A0A543KJC3_9MICO|nr:hypothetical protein [Ornithinimicrobium humiphilum]TQM95178.1 hypothetical protein FB476_0011 [Ornithinimicrobium humiphilum]